LLSGVLLDNSACMYSGNGLDHSLIPTSSSSHCY